MDDQEARRMMAEAGRYFARKRRIVESACLVCGKPIVGLARKMYCSGRCQVRAHRQRQQQAGEAGRPPSANSAAGEAR